jgi:hypothetical protein
MKASQQDFRARQVEQAKESVGGALPARGDPPELLEPGDEALDLPSSFIAA